MKIGIVGQGYLGTAVKTVFEKYYETNTFDLNGDCTCTDIEDLVAASDIIFVCVPTPMKKDGSCDTSIVESVVKDIDETVQCFTNKDHKIVAIKSMDYPLELNGDVSNIGNSDNRSVNDIANMIGGDTINVEPVIEPRETLANHDKAKNVLGWSPKGNLEKWIPSWKEKIGL